MISLGFNQLPVLIPTGEGPELQCCPRSEGTCVPAAAELLCRDSEKTSGTGGFPLLSLRNQTLGNFSSVRAPDPAPTRSLWQGLISKTLEARVAQTQDERASELFPT